MKIQRLLLPAVAALLFAAGPAMAGDGTTTTTQPTTRSIAVLIHVDNHGKVTEVSPDVDLQPSLRTLLRHTLDQMITKPAHDAHGNPVASQMVMQLSMTASQLPNGTYQAKFQYTAAKPWPSGKWVWRNIHNGQMPTLVREDAIANRTLANTQKMNAALDRSIAHGEQVQQQREAQQRQNSSGSSGNSGNSNGGSSH